ncbi:MAG: cysteine desulfurase [Blautia sp.]|nr:cysteine desulfurase [Blautia sp.]
MPVIYMDHSATTPVSERALAAMLPYFREEFGNPSAVYGYGQTAKNTLEKCRERMAKALGAFRSEIYFTSGGTESDNLVIRSIAAMKRDKGRHMITTMIEHNAVRRTFEALEKEGYSVTYLQPDPMGRITPEQLAQAIREDTILISIMMANNVVGTVLPIKELAMTARKRHVLFHTDAVQAVGHIPVNVHELGVDFLSLSAHKFHGPKGVGAVYCRIPNRLLPMQTGGGQEKEVRSGTENIPGIVGMTEALEEAVENLEGSSVYLTGLRDHITRELCAVPGVHRTGDPVNRLPGFCSFIVENIHHSVFLVNALNERGICVSSGSACSASSREASHVLLALGYDQEMSGEALRITLDTENTREEAEYLISSVKECIALVRAREKKKEGTLEGSVRKAAGR